VDTHYSSSTRAIRVLPATERRRCARSATSLQTVALEIVPTTTRVIFPLEVIFPLSVIVHDQAVLSALRDLHRNRYRTVTADALNSTAFEIREAEGAQVAKVFEFKSSSTKSFLASEKSFLFNKATERKLSVRIFPRDKANSLLLIHEEGGSVSVPDERTLKLGTKVAIPVGVRVNARGRVPKGQTPGELVTSRKGFVNRRQTAVLQPQARGVVVAYALIDAFRDRPRLKFTTTAFETAKKQFPIKAQRALDKFALRSGR